MEQQVSTTVRQVIAGARGQVELGYKKCRVAAGSFVDAQDGIGQGNPFGRIRGDTKRVLAVCGGKLLGRGDSDSGHEDGDEMGEFEHDLVVVVVVVLLSWGVGFGLLIGL